MRSFWIVFLCWMFCLWSLPAVAENNTDKYELEQRIKRLEKRLNKIEGECSRPLNNSDRLTDTPGSLSTKRGTDSSTDSAFATSTGLSRTFNPAISVNGLFLGTYRSIGNNDTTADTKTGLKIQEVELKFTANVDTYLRANLGLTFEDDEIEIEETFVDVLLWDQLAFRAGKFFSSFGKHNLLHTHEFPFIDAPLVNEEIFGEEALLEIGAGVSYLLPVPWYSEWVFQFLEGDNVQLFDAPLNDDFAYLVHAKNLFDLDENTTLELGASFATGRNGVGSLLGENNSITQIAGGNLTVKWKPVRRARYKTLIWQTEYIGAWKQTGINALNGLENPDDKKGGIYSYLQYQFAEQWWIQGRYGFFGLHQPAGADDKGRYTALLGYVPSEFSAIRLQYSYLDEELSNEHQLMLQLNFTLGSHPAHRY